MNVTQGRNGAAMKAEAWTGWVLLALTAAFCAFTDVLASIDNRLFDHASMHTGRAPSDQIVVIAIDDLSIANIGPWPWPRDVHAKVIGQLSEAKVVAETVFFFEPQADGSLKYLSEMEQMLSTAQPEDPLTMRLSSIVSSAMKAMNTDGALATSIQQARNVVLPLAVGIDREQGSVETDLPNFVKKSALRAAPGNEFPACSRVQSPLLALGNAAAAVGFLAQRPDHTDGVTRSAPLLINCKGFWVPSLSLVTAAKALNLSTADLRPQPSGAFQTNALKIPPDASGKVWPQFYPGTTAKPAFATDSFFDVYTGKIPPSRYAGKIVILGVTTVGTDMPLATPLSPSTSQTVFLAHTVSSLLRGHFFELPTWGKSVTAGLTVLVGLFVLVALPRLSAGWAAASTAALLLGMLGTEFALIVHQYAWIQLMLPVVMLTFAYLGLMSKRLLLSGTRIAQPGNDSAEANRMTGLALQGQGQLDLAFEHLRKVPVNDALMDNLGNLALDFERKHQLDKAQVVYEHMAGHNPNHKGLRERLRRIKAPLMAPMRGKADGHGDGTQAPGNDAVEKPILGRYQLEKELGRGTMGVVYLGKDTRIGRVVAIKTMALAQEFEGDELEDARQRFFREAETAGRLLHPNIVTIFDAGEEHGLAYIAMAFLKGKDLAGYTQATHLLPMETVISIAARVAEALAYAHDLNVVHRDIKPANIMYEPDTDIVKITDFGIARITDASRTRTGIVLGTPSFMSPEQIMGKKVDGRSDLYSLGVMIYQLLSGTLPFRAASMAELMFKIANEPAPDVRTVNPRIPEALARVVAKALAKHHAERYASGTLMAQDLHALLREHPGDAQPTSSEMLPTATAEPASEFAKTVIMTLPRDAQRPTASTFSTLGGDHEL